MVLTVSGLSYKTAEVYYTAFGLAAVSAQNMYEKIRYITLTIGWPPDAALTAPRLPSVS